MKLGTLAAMVEGQEGRREEESAEIGSLRLLNALKAKPSPKPTKSEGLMYVEAKWNGKPASVILDTGATHN